MSNFWLFLDSFNNMHVTTCFIIYQTLFVLDSVPRSTQKKEPGVADLVRASARLGWREHEVTGSGGLHVTGPHAKQLKRGEEEGANPEVTL